MALGEEDSAELGGWHTVLRPGMTLVCGRALLDLITDFGNRDGVLPPSVRSLRKARSPNPQETGMHGGADARHPVAFRNFAINSLSRI